MDHVANRLAHWPNAKTRAEAARLFVGGMSLARVLGCYPDEVVTGWNGVLRGAARRAIWAHYALVQEAVGEPDIDPEDRAAIALLVSESTVPTGCIRYAVAECRTGSHLGGYNATVPDLGWYRKQSPSSWPVDAPDEEERAERELAKVRSDMCPRCFEVHAGECV